MLMSSSKTTTTTKVIEDKPKRGLNAILTSMNDYRNNVIGAHIGTKAPKKTAPIFKVTLALARTQMGIDEKQKNTIEIVNKASEIFSSNPDKFTKLAIAAQEAEAAEAANDTTAVETKVKGKSKKTKSKDEVVEPIIAETKTKTKTKTKKAESIEVVAEVKKTKGQSKKTDSVESEEKIMAPIKKKPVVKKTPVKQAIVSDSDSDDSDSD
jgi:hypothetical protein